MRAWAVVENEAPLQESELPTPEPQGTGDPAGDPYCGVCHSDIHIWEGRYDLGGGRVMNLKDRGLTLPLAMGHEVVGRVVKLGPQATGVQPGDIRIVFPWVGCGACAACAAEEDNMCVAPRIIGVYRQRRLCDPRAVAASASSGRSRHARPCGGRHLCLLGHHRLFRHPEGDAAAARRADRAGGRGRARAAGHCGAEGAGPSRHRRRWISAPRSAGRPRRAGACGDRGWRRTTGWPRRIVAACGRRRLRHHRSGERHRHGARSRSTRCARAAGWCRSGCSAAS